MKEYVGISCDHSGSMQGICDIAMRDYNEQISAIKENAIRFGVDTIVSVMACSIATNAGTVNKFDVTLSSINAVKKKTDYIANGRCTKLFDSVMEIIKQFEAVPDYNNEDVAFTINVLTDGGDNASVTTGAQLAKKIKQLIATDKWTIAFRVPKGDAAVLVNLGIPRGNILEVDYGNNAEVEASTVVTKQAYANKFQARTAGLRSVSSFYADINAVPTAEVKKELTNISNKVKVIPVALAYGGCSIQEFVEDKTGSYQLGSAYYELSKREEVQPQKKIIVWDSESGNYYTGAEARQLLGIPAGDKVKLLPGSHGTKKVFIQSTSVNRKLVGGTKIVLYFGN